jgi:hypothetical protein
MAGWAQERHHRNAASSVCRSPHHRASPSSFHGWPPSHHCDTFCSSLFTSTKSPLFNRTTSCFSVNARTYFAGFPELFFLIVIDVRPLALGEPIHEECPGSVPEENDSPVAFRFSLPWSGDPLFDDLTAEVGVDSALSGLSNGLAQHCIRNRFLPGKALKPPGFEDPQSIPFSSL